MESILLLIVFLLAISVHSLYIYHYLKKDQKPPVDILGQSSWVMNCKDPVKREYRKEYMLMKLFGGSVISLIFAILVVIYFAYKIYERFII